MKLLVLIVSICLSGSTLAQSSSPIAAEEISQLFSALQNSKCEFSRNGTWYGAEEAAGHLRRKYDYLRKKGLVRSTESFIELAASRSSMSGKPYQVRCGNAHPVPSKSWFTGKLKEFRTRPVGADS